MTRHLVIVACAAAVLFGCGRESAQECFALARNVRNYCDTFNLAGDAAEIEYLTTRLAREYPGEVFALKAFEQGELSKLSKDGFGRLRVGPRTATARIAHREFRFCASTRVASTRRFRLEAEFARLSEQYIEARELAVLAPTLAAMIRIVEEVNAMEIAP